jgi:hypothetical protein
MLQVEAPDTVRLKPQLEDIAVAVIDEYGSLALQPTTSVSVDQLRGVVVDAEAHDSGGQLVYGLLHCRNGWLEELEIYRGDGGPVLRALSSEDFSVRFPSGAFSDIRWFRD